MESFSEATLALLYKAGWHKERKVDTGTYETGLHKTGFPAYPVVIEFLQRFGDLQIVYPTYVSDHTAHLSFAANRVPVGLLTAEGYSNPELMAGYASRVGADLCYIGQAESGHVALLMEPTGAVYVADLMDEDLLNWVGTSGCDAIEAFCSGMTLSRRHMQIARAVLEDTAAQQAAAQQVPCSQQTPAGQTLQQLQADATGSVGM